MTLAVHEPPGIPTAPEAMTPAWLAAALRSVGRWCGGAVESIEVQRFGHGMAGRVARVHASYDAPGGPSTIIAKFPAPEGATRRLADRLRLYGREEAFYRELAGRVPVPVPVLYFAGSAPPDFALLLEDIADAREGDLLRGCTMDEAAAVVEQLARLHAAFWGSPELETMQWLPPPNDDAVTSLAASRGAYAWHRFCQRFGTHMPKQVLQLGAWLAGDRSVLDRLSAAPSTLVHGDMRANNILFAADGAPVVRAFIDWQTAVRARGPIDLANFFVSSLQPEDRRIAERDLLPRYHALLAEHGVTSYTWQDCLQDYRLAVANQFSQVVVLSSLLDVEERLDDGVGQVTGGRLITALLDLRIADLAPRRSPVRRLLARVSGALGR